MNRIHLELIDHTEFKIRHSIRGGGGIEDFSSREKHSIFQTFLSPQCWFQNREFFGGGQVFLLLL